MEAFILHVCCRQLGSAKQLIAKASPDLLGWDGDLLGTLPSMPGQLDGTPFSFQWLKS